MTTGVPDSGQPADDELGEASPPESPETVAAPAPTPPTPAKAERQHQRRPSKHVTERYGVLRRIRSAIALIVLTAVTGAALAALLVGVVALIVIALRKAGG